MGPKYAEIVLLLKSLATTFYFKASLYVNFQLSINKELTPKVR